MFEFIPDETVEVFIRCIDVLFLFFVFFSQSCQFSGTMNVKTNR